MLRKQDNLLEQDKIEIFILRNAWLIVSFVELHFSSSFNYILSSLFGALAIIESLGSYKEKQKYGITS